MDAQLCSGFQPKWFENVASEQKNNTNTKLEKTAAPATTTTSTHFRAKSNQLFGGM